MIKIQDTSYKIQTRNKIQVTRYKQETRCKLQDTNNIQRPITKINFMNTHHFRTVWLLQFGHCILFVSCNLCLVS